jgi:CRISPR system Cascade subunit CasA
MNTSGNLLAEALLSLDLGGGTRERSTLAGAMARLARGERFEFAALQAHQLQPWESLLVQVGALATHAHGAIPEGEAAWRDALLALTGGALEPWCLVVDDLTKPAFMQPPVAGEDFTKKGERERCPDAIDLLVTSKNHDVKQARAAHPTPELWAFALVSLQTMEGFGGAFNYGIARMNGGYGSRPSVGLTSALPLAARFRRDLARWNDERTRLAERFGYRAEGGVALTWCAPWDGVKALSLGELDPCFIEVCRRLRLVREGEEVVLARSTSKSRRIDADTLKGVTGDIWTPVKRGDEPTAFTAPPTGVGYKVLRDVLLSDDYDPPAALEAREGDKGEMFAVVRVLARGQGKTAGLHERVVPVPGKKRGLFAKGDERARAGTLSKRRVEQVGEVQRKVLHPALCALLQAAPDKLDLTDDRTQRWRRAHDERIDPRFFEDLWRDLDVDLTEADRRWLNTCIQLAREVFESALDAVPLPSERAYKARVMAQRVFEGSARKNFALAFAPDATAAPVSVTPVRPEETP